MRYWLIVMVVCGSALTAWAPTEPPCRLTQDGFVRINGLREELRNLMTKNFISKEGLSPHSYPPPMRPP